MSKVTFHGLPAWVGAIHGSTVCDWWDSEPASVKWDRSLMHTVDLAMTPSAVTAGHIQVAQVEVDDFQESGGRTTIGPRWPGGASIGACWLSESYLARLGKPLPGVPSGGGGHAYEYMTIQYLEGEQGNRRFYGFHAQLVQVQNQLSLVDVWNPGTGAGTGKPAFRWWLDLAANADPGTPALVAGTPA
ncbi:MAG: hypothetical protein ABIY55_00610, partial [Kofleriaceae bacterium]